MSAAAPTTLVELFAANAASQPDAPAFIDGSRRTSHAAFAQRCATLAAGLHQMGVRPGDRVGVLAHNHTGFIELLGATAHLGAILSPINWRLSGTEIQQVLDHDQPQTVFASSALLEPLRTASAAHPLRLVCLDGRVPGMASIEEIAGDPSTLPPADATAATPAVLIHTAWTDGRPKAAVLTHGNLLAGAGQLRERWRLDRQTTHLCVLPLFHITALTLLLATACAGGCSVLQPRFDPAAALDAIAQHRVNLLGEFAPMLDTLLQQTQATDRLQSLRHVCGLDTPETIAHFMAACPQAMFWVGFGQSEAGGMVSMAPVSEAAGSTGQALPFCELRVVDENDQPVAEGVVGEIVLRGPTVFAGYWSRPDESARALRGGWLHTGDAGRLDGHRRLFYAGRLPEKELIKTGGENVYPAEVEKALREHPAVQDAAVIGVPDARWGESVRAVCVSRQPTTEQALIDHVGSRIAPYKRPRSVLFVPALPLKPDGGHDREKIRTLYSA